MLIFLGLVDCHVCRRWHWLNLWLSWQPLPCISSVTDCCQSNYLPASASGMPLKECIPYPLQIPGPLPLVGNGAITVAGQEVVGMLGKPPYRFRLFYWYCDTYLGITRFFWTEFSAFSSKIPWIFTDNTTLKIQTPKNSQSHSDIERAQWSHSFSVLTYFTSF